MREVNWGIIGSGGIANKFVVSQRATGTGNIVAAASRTPGKAAAFARKHGIQIAYEDYESLLTCKDVNAVYIATTHNFHYENILLALGAGKHVLCEKPLVCNAAQAGEVIAVARGERRFLMEAMWTRFLPPVAKVRQWLAAGLIGELESIQAAFTVKSKEGAYHRLFNPELAGGALLDLGIYPLSFISMVMGGRRPNSLVASARIGPTGVDIDNEIHLDYPAGVSCTAWSSLDQQRDNRAIIRGSKGCIELAAPFFCGGAATLTNTDGKQTITLTSPPETAFSYEIDETQASIAAGRLESSIMPLAETLMLAEIMDECRWQWGMRYPFERLSG